jgi:hypothetical protein
LTVSLNPPIVEALKRAAAAPYGLPLLSTRTAAGLFAGHAPGKVAARLCKEQGLVEIVRTERKGRATVEICALSEAGWRHLLENGVRQALDAWRTSQPLGDCPLPELLRHLRELLPRLTIGQFHDALRQLHDAGVIRLQPWSGPLYQIPEPALALLAGHQVAYYATLCEEAPLAA